MIVSVASTTVLLFFFPWLNVESNLSGFDIASITTERWPHMRTFPNGIVFILPLVVISIAYQYFRRWRDDKRPRRRATTTAMLAIGLAATAIWIRAYTLNTTDYLNLRSPTIVQPTNPNLPDVEIIDGKRRQYTTSDILSEQFTVAMWLHVMLGASLLFLPWLDQRPPDEPPVY
ncbi:MAG: hypothetical protein CUN55_07855 [Phototrophicales bacterium]|nr:MAG: hypothetical protein CUN55_07855 [Phototrophicales bacterium]